MLNQRLLLYTSLGFVLLLLWQNWVIYATPQTTPQQQTLKANPSARGTLDTPDAGNDPSLYKEGKITQNEVAVSEGADVNIQTDVLSLVLNTRGGSLIQAELTQIPRHQNDPRPYPMFHRDDKGTYIFQSGLLHDKQKGQTHPQDFLAPSHHAIYQSKYEEYTLGSGEDVLRVPLVWESEGIEIKKVYVFRRGSYLVEMEYWVKNKNSNPWIGRMYSQLRRSDEAPVNENLFLYTFTGAAYYDGKYKKFEFSDIGEQPFKQKIVGGWVGMLEHYFLSAVIPTPQLEHDYYTKRVIAGERDEYIIGIRSPAQMVTQNNEQRFRAKIYLGPKKQSNLEEIAPGLELTTDYGIFSVISKPLFWLLDQINNFVGNWGFAILILTLLIKIVFYKLSEVSYRSMARMRKFQPEFSRMRERYKDNKEQLNKEIMSLYKKEKINPLGGCLPILVQIPVFIALYWVLLESVELRQAPFILWIDDLSTRDPFFVLPVLMGLTMFIQSRLNPAPLDPIQAKVMSFLPWIFTVFFAFFPAGLVLYWFANNVISISQQWFITKKMNAI
ncbi:MAG: membrane protein insertase YidC [Candidatus Oxydemutatoraceae bacterium WSBS_2016_MAG_OTU14]